jgi:uncharacterized RDD family membrane protein YckC
LAVVIDSAINSGPVMIAWWYVGSQMDLSLGKIIRMLDSDPSALIALFLSLVPMLLATGAWFLFCEVLEWLLVSLCGCTIGKYLCGIRVIRKNLAYPGLLWGLVRHLLSWIELPIFNGLIGVTLIAFLQDRQRVADLVAGTVVVRAPSLRQARTLAAAQGNATIEM